MRLCVRACMRAWVGVVYVLQQGRSELPFIELFVCTGIILNPSLFNVKTILKLIILQLISAGKTIWSVLQFTILCDFSKPPYRFR